MAKYIIPFDYTAHTSVEVEANNKQQAIEKAEVIAKEDDFLNMENWGCDECYMDKEGIMEV